MDLTMMERVGDRWEKMEGYCSTGQSPKWAVVPVEEEEGGYIRVGLKYCFHVQGCSIRTKFQSNLNGSGMQSTLQPEPDNVGVKLGPNTLTLKIEV
jgi:hypothetical protein